MQTEHDALDDVQDAGLIPIQHDQDLTITEARLAIDVGLAERFSAGLMLPVRLVSTRIVYRNGAGMPVDLVTPSTHHRNETLSGIADPMLLGAYSRWGMTLRAGFTVPLGRTEEDPFANADEPHQHIQMGTGTFNPVVSIEGGYSWDRWRVSGYGFTQQVLYENSKGYQAGDRYAAGVALRRALGTWNVRGGLEVQGETFEAWNGMRYRDEGNQGRIDGLVSAGASWQMTPDFSLDATLKVSFVNHVVGGQLYMPALLEVGASYTFGAKRAPAEGHEDEHDHDHGHEHGDEHAHDEHGDEHGDEHAPLDTSGADIADLGANGAAVDLVPVPGKITIFDFWAPWCEPCKTLEPALVELARANPQGVAIRRIDVVDWETPVVAQHLTPRGFDLPHIKIYSATGELIYEESSGPGKLQAMIEAIRAIVGRSVTVTVTEKGFEPGTVTVPRGVPVTLRFTRKVERTCATEVVMDVDGKRIEHKLPLGTPTELTVTFPTAGTVVYGCGMDKMISGTIVVQ